MKKLLLALLIPCHIFACQDCVEYLQDKMDSVSTQIIRLENSYFDDPVILAYFFGKFEAYEDALQYAEHINK